MTGAGKNMKSSKWPYGIAAIGGAFVLFILVFVGIATRQSFDLVGQNYYRQAETYQQQIDKIARSASLASNIKINYLQDDRRLVLVFPDTHTPDSIKGKIRLYRPSNSSKDRTYSIDLTADWSQSIPVDSLIPGLWRIKVDWNDHKDAFYYEMALVIQE
jgi:hypothetical protein